MVIALLCSAEGCPAALEGEKSGQGIRHQAADRRDNMLRSPLRFGIPNAVSGTKSSGKS